MILLTYIDKICFKIQNVFHVSSRLFFVGSKLNSDLDPKVNVGLHQGTVPGLVVVLPFREDEARVI